MSTETIIMRPFHSAVSLAERMGPLTTAATALGVILAPFFAMAYRDYRAYVTLGPHGLTNDLSGWFKQLRMSTTARKDTTVPAPYNMDEVAKAAGPHAKTSYLSRGGDFDLPPRAGARPQVCHFAAPQRQLTDQAPQQRQERMFAYLGALVKANSAVLRSDLSCLEGPVPALQLRDGTPRAALLKATKGEIAHVHPADGSTHVMLSLVDSRLIIERGWGQRHRLSGSTLPWGFTLIYAPRDEAEMEVWKEVVCAAAKFCAADAGDIHAPSSNK